MKSKIKVLGIYISNFETYTRHSGVADEEQKMVLGGNYLLKLSKGVILKKSLGNPALN